MIEQCDPIIKKSGCISRHFDIQFYVMSKDLDSLEASCAHSEDFLPFSIEETRTQCRNNMKCVENYMVAFF